MVNIEIRLIIFFSVKNGEALYSQQKQDQELTVAQIMNSLLPLLLDSYYFCPPLCLSLHESVRKAFLSLLAVLWNSAFKCIYLSFSPFPFTSLLFSTICKASSDNHFTFLHFFFLEMVLITASCTMSQTSVHSSSGTLSIRSNPLNLFVTSTV